MLDTKNPKKLEKIYTLLENFGLLQLDFESAQKAGMIHINLYDKGMPIQSEDSMIAGICLVKNEALLTRNIKHFNRVTELQVETY